MGSDNYSRCFLNMPSHRGSVDMKCQQKQAKSFSHVWICSKFMHLNCGDFYESVYGCHAKDMHENSQE